MVQKKILFLSFILIFFLSTLVVAAEKETKTKSEINPIVEKINIGMTPTQVRRIAGMPITMTKTTWKYDSFFIIFEQGRVSCLLDNNCFGQWPNCKAYQQRSESCLIK